MKSKKQKHYERGVWAERLAALILMFKGHRILAMRYKTPGGEADIISVRGRMLVITEVKMRAEIVGALESVTIRNQKRVEQAARHFLSHNPRYGAHDLRFDVMAMAWPFSVRHLDNAWRPGS